MQLANRFEISGAWPVLRAIQILVGGVLVALTLLPSRVIQDGPSLCLIKQVFGVECYGCGMTRAVSLLLHGQIAPALTYNRGSVIVLPALILVALSAVYKGHGHKAA